MMGEIPYDIALQLSHVRFPFERNVSLDSFYSKSFFFKALFLIERIAHLFEGFIVQSF